MENVGGNRVLQEHVGKHLHPWLDHPVQQLDVCGDIEVDALQEELTQYNMAHITRDPFPIPGTMTVNFGYIILNNSVASVQNHLSFRLCKKLAISESLWLVTNVLNTTF